MYIIVKETYIEDEEVIDSIGTNFTYEVIGKCTKEIGLEYIDKKKMYEDSSNTRYKLLQIKEIKEVPSYPDKIFIMAIVANGLPRCMPMSVLIQKVNFITSQKIDNIDSILKGEYKYERKYLGAELIYSYIESDINDTNESLKDKAYKKIVKVINQIQTNTNNLFDTNN